MNERIKSSARAFAAGPRKLFRAAKARAVVERSAIRGRIRRSIIVSMSQFGERFSLWALLK